MWWFFTISRRVKKISLKWSLYQYKIHVRRELIIFFLSIGLHCRVIRRREVGREIVFAEVIIRAGGITCEHPCWFIPRNDLLRPDLEIFRRETLRAFAKLWYPAARRTKKFKEESFLHRGKTLQERLRQTAHHITNHREIIRASNKVLLF